MIEQQPRNREELYEQIRKSSKESFILEDMIRLGFWPAQGEMPFDPADEIRRKTEIEKELANLRTQNRQLSNEKKLLTLFRKEKLKESKKKQLETKLRHEKEKQERA